MKIQLEKVSNARDLGGIVTPYGTVQHNRLLRAGHLSLATQKDVETLLNHNLRRIVDLRTDVEIANNPDVTMPNVSWVNVPIIHATTFGISYEKLNGQEIFDKLQAGIQRMLNRGETPIEHMRILYKKFVQDEFSRKGYGKFLKLLANEPIDGATLWHCTGGKDRCGTCAALLLYCLGADKDTIMHDYLLTNEQTLNHAQSILGKVRPFVNDDNLQLVQSMLLVDKSYLNSFWQEIDTHFGSVDSFLIACGVTEQDIEKLRKNYLL